MKVAIKPSDFEKLLQKITTFDSLNFSYIINEFGIFIDEIRCQSSNSIFQEILFDIKEDSEDVFFEKFANILKTTGEEKIAQNIQDILTENGNIEINIDPKEDASLKYGQYNASIDEIKEFYISMEYQGN